MLPPVLFLIFNRPSTAKRVFEAIRAAKPTRLYVAADGPRKGKPGETVLCEQTRAIATQVDWPCEVKTLFRSENLSCGIAVSEAITWFFEHEESGIILEDDCLPHPSFFRYCGELLDYYNGDSRISIISGANYQDGKKRGIGSYYFSNHLYIWGWAAWRRTWNDFQLDVNSLNEDEVLSAIQKTNKTKKMQDYWINIWNEMKLKKIDTWDYPFYFSQLAKGRISIVPNVNLISNIGFDAQALHTTDVSSPASNMPFHPINFPLIHPKKITADIKAERYTQEHYYQLAFSVRVKRKLCRIVKQILRLR